MIIKNVNLETVCGVTSTIPENTMAEVAFAGKSNVGKSSLINTLMNRKSLARTSAQPGKTQTINFYNINDRMYLVDLPGYGYANANMEIKAQWGKMIENYLHVSKQLKAVFLLIDIRHDPSENDCLMYNWIKEQGFAPIIIATKADKLKRSQINEHVQTIHRVLNTAPDTYVFPFSAETKQGREEIWELIDALVLPQEELQAMEEERLLKKAKKHAANSKNGKQVQATASEQNGKKPRWKAIGKPVAKKTKENAKRKAEKNKKRGK